MIWHKKLTATSASAPAQTPAANIGRTLGKKMSVMKTSRCVSCLLMFIAMFAVSSLARASEPGSEYDALSPANCRDVVKQVGRIVDRIDATHDMPASRFKENQPSHVVDSPIGKVRQFGPEDCAGISYLLHVAEPGLPHVVRVPS